MKSTPKWFLIPPAIAAMLILGTLSMQGGGPAAAKPDPRAAAPAGAGVPIEGDLQKNPRPAPVLPRTPDLWQMSSALLGVLLLGVGAIVLLRRLRQGPGPKAGQSLIALRQTLRLSPRQAIHAIEFDERILLVGDSDKGLVLLEHGRLPDRLADEAEVLARSTGIDTTVGDIDDGAVPKNLVIPRPARTGAPTPTTAAAATPAAPGVGLGDFRTLLKKAGRT
jgi:flagellar biogenesis protein FliO